MEEEFKTDSDLKPDASDRHASRERKTRPSRSLKVSRQHIMMGVGILVLLVLIVAIGLTPEPKVKSDVKGIDLSNNSGSEGGVTTNVPTPPPEAATSDNNQVQTGQAQEISIPKISTTPTEAIQLPPKNSGEQRIELPGNVLDALMQQQKEMDKITSQSRLPTNPATLKSSEPLDKGHSTHDGRTPLPNKTPIASNPAASNKASTTVTEKIASPHSSAKNTSTAHQTVKNAPANHYTLQLSGASRPDTLNALAKKHHLPDYWVYETIRSGKAWYVLVSGNYPNSVKAKQAISQLPTEIKAQNPWVRPINQVKKEIKK